MPGLRLTVDLTVAMRCQPGLWGQPDTIASTPCAPTIRHRDDAQRYSLPPGRRSFFFSGLWRQLQRPALSRLVRLLVRLRRLPEPAADAEEQRSPGD